MKYSLAGAVKQTDFPGVRMWRMPQASFLCGQTLAAKAGPHGKASA